MNSKILAGTIGLATLAFVGPLAAQQDNRDAEYRRDCTGDYTRLCSAYSPGSDEVGQCFQQRIREVSPRCRATIAKYNKRR